MANDPSDTVHLVERLRAGDRQALTDLFQRHRDRLRRMVELRMDARLQGRVDASDVLQDAFLDAAAAENEDVRKSHLQRHCQQVKQRARELSPTTRKAFELQNRCCPASSSRTTPMRASKARTQRSSSPSGMSFALSTSLGSRPA